MFVLSNISPQKLPIQFSIFMFSQEAPNSDCQIFLFCSWIICTFGLHVSITIPWTCPANISFILCFAITANGLIYCSIMLKFSKWWELNDARQKIFQFDHNCQPNYSANSFFGYWFVRKLIRSFPKTSGALVVWVLTNKQKKKRRRI